MSEAAQPANACFWRCADIGRLSELNVHAGSKADTLAGQAKGSIASLERKSAAGVRLNRRNSEPLNCRAIRPRSTSCSGSGPREFMDSGRANPVGIAFSIIF